MEDDKNQPATPGVSWAKPGVKVVFVDDTPVASTEDWESLTRGEVYIIAELASLSICNGPYAGSVPVRVEGHTHWWALPRFRPLAYPPQAAETDLKLFRELLHTSPALRLDYLLESLNREEEVDLAASRG